MTAPDTAIHRRVAALRRGEDPTVIARCASGWIVLGDPQVVPGYCLVLPDPVVPHLNALAPLRRARFLADVTGLGDVLLEITGAARINYEILGNLEPALHAHVIPRSLDESEELRSRPVWFYDWNSAPAFDPVQHGSLMSRITDALNALGLSIEE